MTPTKQGRTAGYTEIRARVLQHSEPDGVPRDALDDLETLAARWIQNAALREELLAEFLAGAHNRLVDRADTPKTDPDLGDAERRIENLHRALRDLGAALLDLGVDGGAGRRDRAKLARRWGFDHAKEHLAGAALLTRLGRMGLDTSTFNAALQRLGDDSVLISSGLKETGRPRRGGRPRQAARTDCAALALDVLERFQIPPGHHRRFVAGALSLERFPVPEDMDEVMRAARERLATRKNPRRR